jgi:ABC-2 type transport system permease protein
MPLAAHFSRLTDQAFVCCSPGYSNGCPGIFMPEYKKEQQHMVKYLRTAQMSCLEKTNGGVYYLLPDILVKICTLIPLVYLWRVVMASGVEVGMSMEQMLSYTYIAALLGDLLVVKTLAVGWLSEGVLLKLYGRPLSTIGQLVAQTAGSWLPMLALFSLPMALLSPLLGIRLIPASSWFFPSLILCISLGFAIDLMFACLSIKLRNMNWLVSRIRAAIVAVLSGTVIPISLLPLGLSQAMRYQPFASLGGAPLSIFAGSAEPMRVLALQLLWNAVLWPAALLIYRKSQEGMVSYGG